MISVFVSGRSVRACRRRWGLGDVQGIRPVGRRDVAGGFRSGRRVPSRLSDLRTGGDLLGDCLIEFCVEHGDMGLCRLLRSIQLTRVHFEDEERSDRDNVQALSGMSRSMSGRRRLSTCCCRSAGQPQCYGLRQSSPERARRPAGPAGSSCRVDGIGDGWGVAARPGTIHSRFRQCSWGCSPECQPGNPLGVTRDRYRAPFPARQVLLRLQGRASANRTGCCEPVTDPAGAGRTA